MTIPVDQGSAYPSHIQDYDGFDITTIDTNRWKTKVESGSTTIAQSGGELVFTNTGAGTKGTSYLETIREFGKNWRISVDLKLATTTGTSGEASLVLYKDANNYIKVGPYKDGATNCNCLLRRMKAGTLISTALTGDAIDPSNYSTHTVVVLGDTLIFLYKGVIVTSFPFAEMHGYTMRIEAGTGANSDTLSAKANDFEILNHVDTLLLTIGKTVREIYDKVGTSIVTNVSGTLAISNTTEQFLTFQQSVYGSKFKLYLFADLKGANIDYCRLYKSATSAFTNQDEVVNSLQSNTVLLLPTSGAAAGDCIYFGNEEEFHRLDVYMESAAANTDNTFVWEYWNGSAWATLTVSDGTLSSSKVFGKSGKVTWSTSLSKTTINSVNCYWVRARATVVGSSLPKATHAQVSEVAAVGFDPLAEFLSSLTVRIYRKKSDSTWAVLPVDLGLPFTQCILYRNVDVNGAMAWGDIRIGFKLSATPTASIDIEYEGFVETIEA
jgi:hypothetical protein